MGENGLYWNRSIGQATSQGFHRWNDLPSPEGQVVSLVTGLSDSHPIRTQKKCRAVFRSRVLLDRGFDSHGLDSIVTSLFVLNWLS